MAVGHQLEIQPQGGLVTLTGRAAGSALAVLAIIPGAAW
ncbi:hypothetical protein ABIC16_001426 [Sphingomonas sp. PvP055]